MAGRDGEQRGQAAEQAGHLRRRGPAARRRRPCGAGPGRAPPRGPSRWPPPSRPPARRRSAAHRGRRPLVRGDRLGVPGVQVGVVPVGLGRLRGDRVERRPAPPRPAPARRCARRRAARSPRRRASVRARAALTWPVSLASPPAGRRSPWRRDQRALGGGELALQLLAVLDRLGQPDLVLGERGAQLLLLLADRARPRRPAGPGRGRALVVRGGAEVAQPLGGQLLGGSGSAPAARTSWYQVSWPAAAAARPRRGRLQLGEPALDLGGSPPPAAPLPQRRLVGDLPVQRGRSVARSSASSRSRASRRSAWIPAARRATSACRPSGPSWRRSSAVRSVSRLRLACIASSLRSVFSLRLRCLRTPAASSMNARRSSGVACSTASSWPCPTMTCISRPMPESDSSSWMSSSRQEPPLISYSPHRRGTSGG